MPEQFYNLKINRKLELVLHLVDLFPDGAILTLVGDFTYLDLHGLRGIMLTAIEYPTNARITILLDSTAKEILKRSIIPRVGIANRIQHIIVETKTGKMLFAAVTGFMRMARVLPKRSSAGMSLIRWLSRACFVVTQSRNNRGVFKADLAIIQIE